MVTDEEERSPFMPGYLLCDACEGVSFQIVYSLAYAHRHISSLKPLTMTYEHNLKKLSARIYRDQVPWHIRKDKRRKNKLIDREQRVTNKLVNEYYSRHRAAPRYSRCDPGSEL